MDTALYVVAAALVIGPLLAVLTTRAIAKRETRRANRDALFKTLMRTRLWPASSEHVGALNLVEIEFDGDQRVLAAWKALFTHLTMQARRKAEEELGADLSDEELRQREAAFQERLAEERGLLLTVLLKEMAKALGYRPDQILVLDSGLAPVGWFEEHLEQQAVRQLMVDIYTGRRALPVLMFEAGKEVAPPATDAPKQGGNGSRKRGSRRQEQAKED